MPAPPITSKPDTDERTLPRAAAVVGLFVCLLGVWVAARCGLARLLASYGSEKTVLTAADAAVRFGPSDPETHYARAVVLSDTGRYGEASKEFARAAALRPGDYFLWFELGRARDQMGDTEGASRAFKQAVTLAPYYAQARWQLGNLLLRTAATDAAFAELRRAAHSDPDLFPALLDLAWSVSPEGNDARAVEQAVGAETPEERLRLAHFFAKHDSADAALRMFRAAGDAPAQERRALISELLARKRFIEAFEVWSTTPPAAGDGASVNHAISGNVIDGGFEGGIRLEESGFGWATARGLNSAVRFSLDATEPAGGGGRSLRLDFSGAPPPSKHLVTQLVLVEPNARYRLSFVARTRDLTSGGLPFVAVFDAGDDAQALARSKTLTGGTSNWQHYAVEFKTASGTPAIVIALRRQYCADANCPIFGSVWVDDFSLERY